MRRNLFWAALLLGASAALCAAERNPVRPPAASDGGAQRLIVKYRAVRDAAGVRVESTESRQRLLAKRAGFAIRRTREISPDMQALDLGPEVSREALVRALARLRADPEVEFADVDHRRSIHAVPNDPLHDGQWFLKNVEAAAIDAQAAWDTTSGSKGVVIAVLDTGVRFDHQDLKKASEAGRLLPGYDFVSPEAGGTFKTANDGNGRDSDPSDPGDWISTADTSAAPFTDCEVADSSWHGTRVSGIIGALSNNGVGVSGIDWNGWILPVRVLGKCGGFDSDVIAGMRWAAGLHVSGVPDNPHPAKVLNMSLGGATPCSTSYQNAVNELAAIGVLVVVSAGNESGPVDAPANCAGVVGVAGVRHAGTKVGFSSLGPEVALSAPGGNCGSVSGNCAYTLDTTTNTGTTSPGTNGYTDASNYNIGTSFSSPIVAGIAALMSSVNGNLGASQLRDRLRESAVTFPHVATLPDCHAPVDATDIQDTECNCTADTCGAGMANAREAVADASRPIAAISAPDTFAPGDEVSLDASGSVAACDRTIASYSWAVVDPGASPPAIVGANSANASVTAPATDPFVIRLTVTDDAGLQDTADITIEPTSSSTSAPASAGNANTACPVPITIAQTPTTPTSEKKKGGGGASDPLWVLALATLLVARLSAWIRDGAADRRRACPARRAWHA